MAQLGTGKWMNMNMGAKTSRELCQLRLAEDDSSFPRKYCTCTNMFNNDNILGQESNSKSANA